MVGPEDLYPALLGPAWGALPLVVRRLHQEGRARGQVTIEQGRSGAARWLARVLGFPSSGENVATVLAVQLLGEEQIWSRRFAEDILVSRQRRAGDCLAERFGSFECVFHLRPTARGIDYDLVGAGLVLGGFRLPLPRGLAPHISARTWAEENAMRLEVTMSAPLFGRILRYHGLVRPEGDEAPA
jgi:Domain of unknown function (DUF4166)